VKLALHLVLVVKAFVGVGYAVFGLTTFKGSSLV
jgi:hypothetical protein